MGAQGMREHKCPQMAIDKLLALKTDSHTHQTEYLPLQYDKGLPKWTLKKLEDMAAAGSHVYSVNGKVISYGGVENGLGWDLYKDSFGKEMMLEAAQSTYTTLFETPQTFEDMTEEQRAYWEHELAGKWQARSPDQFKVIALLSNIPPPAS